MLYIFALGLVGFPREEFSSLLPGGWWPGCHCSEGWEFSHLVISLNPHIGEGPQEDLTDSWPVSCTSPVKSSSYTPLSLECGFCLPSPLLEASWRTSSWDSDVVLRPCGQYMLLNPVKSSIKLLRFGEWLWGSTCLAATQDKPLPFAYSTCHPPV